MNTGDCAAWRCWLRGPALALLNVIERNPQAVIEALA
jgi:hypothetical protein